MRVTSTPDDPHYSSEARKVWLNGVEVRGWTEADEFRRVVVTPEKVHNGGVLIERLPSDDEPAVPVTVPSVTPATVTQPGSTTTPPRTPPAAAAAVAVPAPAPSPAPGGAAVFAATPAPTTLDVASPPRR